jgi:HPt (histidine-containing phosphotransfer) domain-containing protein
LWDWRPEWGGVDQLTKRRYRCRTRAFSAACLPGFGRRRAKLDPQKNAQHSGRATAEGERMAQAAISVPADVRAPRAEHAPAEAIDRGHLARMTFGDRSLQQEVLQLFVRQAELLLERMRGGNAAAMASLAHTLTGSARGIGAWAVARTAEAAEVAATAGGAPAECDLALRELSAAVAEARREIADLLGAD